MVTARKMGRIQERTKGGPPHAAGEKQKESVAPREREREREREKERERVCVCVWHKREPRRGLTDRDVCC
jgi:hypothetical protein